MAHSRIFTAILIIQNKYFVELKAKASEFEAAFAHNYKSVKILTIKPERAKFMIIIYRFPSVF